MSTPDRFAGERLRLSPFHPRLQEFNVREAWAAWNGYKFAEYYYDAEFEYFCIRNRCGTYDICPMQKYEITGSEAELMLDRMVTRDIRKLGHDRVAYCVWCTDEGRLIDDGTVFRLAADRFMLNCGSPCTEWLRHSSFGFDDVRVTDVTDDIAGLSLQGPTSFSVLRKMGLETLSRARPFDVMRFPYHGETLMVSRTGFTGDLGYELWVPAALGLQLWDDVYAAGADYGIHPYGEAATNMARLEAGFIMPGMEFNESLHTVHHRYDQTPFELDLGWLVDFAKPHFNGRQALLAERTRGPRYRLTRLDVEGNRPADGAFIYRNRRCTQEVGYVTSAMWSPAVKANIALAMIRTEHSRSELWAEIYYQRELRHRSRVARCRPQDRPFWAPARARATPPPAF